ncbi:hypothetical protein QYF36_002217 [Acer negundo]|nr:hypothetical protein QYF36_002217 [Acer negundo]
MASNFEIDRLLYSSSSDDDLEMITIAAIARRRQNKSKCGGSIDGHTTIWRDQLAGVLGLSSLQKISDAMRMLAYGVADDAVDEYVRIGESTTIESLKKFVRAVIEIFSDEYLRSPNSNDVARLLANIMDFRKC